ncbi:MAG: restriction endonuclease subunit S [Sphingobacteriales bacterium]|nr:MAG: restriction endonuclease subunit S [Sphingobacteriales bacterium]
MEGLEVVEIKYNALENIIDYRIESEYFDKRFLNNEKLLRKNSIPFFEVANYDNGRAYASDKFSELNLWENRSVKVAKIGDVTQKRFIEQWENLELEEFIFQKGELLKVDDILMSLTGDPPDVGKVSLIFEVPCNATWNQRVAKVYLRDEQTVFISNRVFFVILSTKYCREQLERYAKGIRQRNLGTECLQEMKVPVISNSFQEVIEKTIQTYYLKIQQSKVLYTEAENILLQELGLINWQPTIKNNNTKTLKESFLSSGRIDAEYYQPKYDEIENIIKEYKDGWSTIGNSLLEINTGDFCNEYHEKAEGLTFYIRNTNISKGRIVEDEKYFVSTNGLTKFTKEGDILTARVGAIGSFGTVNKKFENSIYSDNVLCLRLHHNLLPDVYTCYLNSNINAELMEKIAGGSVQPLITQTSIKDLVIPIFPNNIQKVVSEKMQQSFKLQAQSKELLEAAKRAVEIAIEQNEIAALDFLNDY